MINEGETYATTLITQLGSLLDRQIDSAVNGRLEQMEDQIKASSALICDIVQTGDLDCQATQAQLEPIVRRYKRLELILASAIENTKDELRHVKISRKMLAVYRVSNR